MSRGDPVSELLTVASADRFEFEAGDTCEAELENGFMVVAIEKGSVDVESPSFEGEVHTGQVFVIPDSSGGCRLSSRSKGVCTAIELSGSLIKKIMDGHIKDGKMFSPSGLPDVLEAARALEYSVTPEQISETAYTLLMRLHQSCGKYGVREGYPAPVETALGIINGEYAFLDGVEDIADRVGVTPHHLIRLFSKYVGIPPGRYLKLRRLECARDLLTQPGISISTAAELSGFSDPNYFSKVFRKENGVTPSEYAAAHSGEKKGGAQVQRLIDESYL